MFSTSDKVVCVNDLFTPDAALWFTGLPKRDVVYVVRGIDERGTRDGVYLVGIRGNIWFDGTERGFSPTRFRKLTDIQAENASALCANARREVRGASPRNLDGVVGSLDSEA